MPATSTEQQRICSYLNRISRATCSEKEAESELTKGSGWFIIKSEITHDDKSDTNRYFQVFFLDAKLELGFFSSSSSTVFTPGILQIDTNGHLTTLNSSYLPMDVKIKFLFTDKKLDLEIDDWKMDICTFCTIM